MKSPASAAILGIAVIMVLAVIVYNTIGTRPPPAPPPESTQSQSASPTPLTSYESKIMQLKKDLDGIYTSGRPGEVSLTLTESEANEAAISMVTRSGAAAPNIRGVGVDFQPGSILVTTVDSAAAGIGFRMSVTSTVRIENGRLEVKTGAVDVPFLLRSFKNSFAGMVREKTQELLDRMMPASLGFDGQIDLTFTDVQTDDTSMTIRAMARPAG